MDRIFFVGIVTFLFMVISACDTENEVIDDNVEELQEETEAIDTDTEIDETDMEDEAVAEMEESEEDVMEEEDDMIEMEEESSIVIDDDAILVGSGTFESNSSYSVGGSFDIFESDGQFIIELDQNFMAVGVPDLVIYLSNDNGSNQNASEISEAILDTGSQTFLIPENLDPNDYEYVLLFCKKYEARVGFGPIER